jgi:hypothetical protein
VSRHWLSVFLFAVGRFGGLDSNCFLNGLVVVMVGGVLHF